MQPTRTRVPQVWDDAELSLHAQLSLEAFVTRRLAESDQLYRAQLIDWTKVVHRLLRAIRDLDRERPDAEIIRSILRDPQLNRALRYVAGPPVSLDDLGALATRRSARLSNRTMRADDQLSGNILSLICRLSDGARFPWLKEKRAARQYELKHAIRCTAVLLASQSMQTQRRAYGRAVEAALRERLVDIGFKLVASANGGRINAPVHMPGAGSFYGECSVHGRRTDLLIGLPDGRAIAVEAKDSSSVVNSVKRVLNDTAAKARFWQTKFGETLLPVALLSGVFGVDSLRSAQRGGLYLVFAHDLDNFVAWLRSA